LKVLGQSETAAREMQVRLTSVLGMEGHSAIVEVDSPSAGLDLPAAVAVLRGMEELAGVKPDARVPLFQDNAVFVGELSLEGVVRPARGAACMRDFGPLYVARSQIDARTFGAAFGLNRLSDVRNLPVELEPFPFQTYERTLLVGAPGTGKTMLARNLAESWLCADEALEVLRVYSSAGLDYLTPKVPFRAPHHTVSARGMLGDRKAARPGEVALAQHGVLFLDEITEFSKATLQATAEALKTWKPRRVIAATNPCPCGFREPRCACSATTRDAYMKRAREHAAIVGIVDIWPIKGTEKHGY
jgi:hypothetical protein